MRGEALGAGGRRPLAGLRVLNTRPRESADALSDRLQELGAEVLAVPAIGIGEASDPAAFRSALASWRRFDWLVVTSANGAEAVVRESSGRPPESLRFAALGEKCAQPFFAVSWSVSLVLNDPKPDADKLGEQLGGLLRNGEAVLVVQGELADQELRQRLESYGARVQQVCAYRTLECPEPEALRLALESRPEAVVFCSPSAVRGCVRALSAERLRDRLSESALVSLGPKTSAELGHFGFERVLEARRHDLDGLVEAVLDATHKGEAEQR